MLLAPRSDLREASFALLCLAFDQVGDSLLLCDAEHRIIYANAASCDDLGYRQEELLGLGISTIATALTPAHIAEVERLLDTPHSLLIAGLNRAKDGRLIPVDSNLKAFTFNDQRLMLLTNRNLTQHKLTEQALRKTESRLTALIDTIPDLVWMKDINGVYLACNPAFESFFGAPASTILGKTDYDFVSREQADFFRQKDLEAIAAQRVCINEETIIYATDGRSGLLETRKVPVTGATGEMLGVLGIGRDISELRNYESRLHETAFRDSLTGLPNRALLNERLQQSLNEANRRGHLLGLLVVDLDRFKEINDTHGPGTGDILLYQAAQRLNGLMRAYDTVARLGADEFAIMLPEISEPADLGCMSRKILDAMARPFQINNQDLFISACIGIAVFPDDGKHAEALLQYADSALYDAKARGRSCFRFYSSELTLKSKDRAALETALRHAEADGQLELYFQPKVDLSNGHLVGAEALLRWHHPNLGLVPPDKFIKIAENTGLIVSIGAWVLTKACIAAQRWNASGKRELKVAVNLSSRQFRDDDLLSIVRSILTLTGCEARWLELEITESLLLDDDNGVRTTLQAFREMGMTIAIDDFGTGYSALGYLKRFPIDVLKIDRSFTRDVTLERDSTELVKAIITMARSLRLELVAEGIETEAQESFLQAHGCHLGQGYRYGKPMPKEKFEEQLLLAEQGAYHCWLDERATITNPD
ncbi:MAG: EAL domain-containing protein [Azonexus sp.]